MAMKKHALLIGVEDYDEEEITRLKFARADACAVGERLKNRCNFDHVRVLADSEGANKPTLVNIVRAIEDAVGELRPKDLFVLFFAGHGLEKDGSGYLLVSDSLSGRPEYGSLSLELLRNTLQNLSAGQRILLIDACRNHPEAARSDAPNCMGDVISRDILSAARPGADGGATTALLVACQSGQRAYEWSAKGHGVFTHYILEGLDGAAWEGEALRFERLAEYASEEVCAWSHNMPNLTTPQEPWYEKLGRPRPIIVGVGQGSEGQAKAASPQAKKTGRRSSREETVAPHVRESILLAFQQSERVIARGGEVSEYLKTLGAKQWGVWGKAAERGMPEAQWLFGQCCLHGIGVSIAREEAAAWFRKAAEQGLPAAQWSLADCLLEEGGVLEDPLEGLTWALKAAEGGHAPSQVLVGEAYAQGRGVSEDKKEAFGWYRKAAEQGDACAQSALGDCYYTGSGVAKDVSEAVRWYRKAAEQDDAAAQSYLGMCYHNGIGVAKDASEAVRWYRKAAEQGDAAAQTNLGICYDNGTGVAKDVSEAVRWYRKAAEQGYAVAQNNLGVCYQYGTGVEKDASEAVRWYRKAAEQGDAHAQNILGDCYYSGTGVAKDVSEAVRWYRKAAEQGYAAAQYNLGVCYDNGTGVEKDVSEAVAWYRKAAAQGDAKAQRRLDSLGRSTNPKKSKS